MRFHQATTFLSVDESIALAAACDDLGYAGIFLSDHLVNPRELRSRYTYSTAPDGSPFWPKETGWPDPMCLVSAMAAVTRTLTFTTGVYVAPVRDLITVAKTVGTAAAISHDRVRLGVGVGWCEEEFLLTGQDFHTRGKRLDEMVVALRALWQGGWVEHHGTYYDVPACQMNPSPSRPVPILAGGDSAPAIRRAATLCDGWINTGPVPPDEALAQAARLGEARAAAGRAEEPFSICLAVRARPDVDLYRRLEEAGVTDLLCAPWMAVRAEAASSPEALLATRVAACERFAEDVVVKLA